MGRSGINIVDRSGKRRLPVGTEDFSIVLDRYTYVDKSFLISELLEKSYGGTTLFCRPRRFGKSLAMRMLQCFFEAPVDGYVPERGGMFEGLAVWNDPEARAEAGQHPVIYLSLNGVGGDTWHAAQDEFAKRIAAEISRHGYLLESDAPDSFEREVLERLASQNPAGADLSGSLALLARLLHRFHGERCAILIDEYDYPVMTAHLKGYREEAVDFMRGWLTEALKATTDLFLGVLTGVQRISRESVFSQLNNIKVNTALDRRFSEAFGFTEPEVCALAEHVGATELLEEMREWYDGYCFGGTDVYNPWSVVNYLDECNGPKLYWGNTSSNDIVHGLVQHASLESAQELARLSEGATQRHVLRLDTVFDDLDQPESIWSQLYLAGYLTTDDTNSPEWEPRELRIPNKEVSVLYIREFVERAQRIAGGRASLDDLHRALMSCDTKGVELALGNVLLDTPSYHDLVHERDYQNLLAGLLYAIPGYLPARTNRETGDGRADITIEPEPAQEAFLPAICIECKYMHHEQVPGGATERQDVLRSRAAQGISQIREQRYVTGLAGQGACLWGIAFSGKHVAAICETL